MYDEYNEEDVERFGREGGAFLIKNKIIDTDSLEEVRQFRREIAEEEIEKTEGKGSFNIIKIRERSDDSMYNDYDDSAFNDEEDLKDLMEIFLEEEIDGGEFEKAKKKMPEKLVAGLKEAFKILNEHKDYLDEDLKNAMQYISRILTKYPEPGKYPYPSKKVKKSEPMEWPSVMAQLFGGIDRPDFEKSEIPEPTKENPFPSIDTAIEKKANKISQVEEDLEEDYDDEDE